MRGEVQLGNKERTSNGRKKRKEKGKRKGRKVYV